MVANVIKTDMNYKDLDVFLGILAGKNQYFLFYNTIILWDINYTFDFLTFAL